MNQQRLGPYVLQSVLGRGGMGTVYRAVDSQSGATVAVKALAPTLSLDEHFRARFESEIETMTKMDHPNIVRILGYGQDEGNLFFAMELVEGMSLFALQKSGVLFDWRQVLRIALDVCAGLQHAHNRGIIHRDLKPGNLIRENTGNVKITDFGIAKTFGSSQLTGEGSVLGTMDFMAPEQAQGGKVTPRSDLYSLGAVMYTLLSRRPPLKGETLEQTIRNLTSVRPVSIRKLVPAVPHEFAAVIERLLEKDPQKRFATSLSLSKFLLDLQTQLRDTAEAKTQAGEEPMTREVARVDTSLAYDFVVDPKATKSPGTAVEAAKGTSLKPGNATVGAELATREVAAVEVPVTVPQPDFFSTVVRNQIPAEVEPAPTRNWSVWFLATGFIIVFSLLVSGLYYKLRRPTADELLQTIAAAGPAPNRAQEAIGQFLKFYPDHERAADVAQMKEIADAIVFRNVLQRGRRLTLTSMEQQFLELTDFDSPGDFKKLNAMITLLEANTELDTATRRLLSAAKAFSSKFRMDAEQHASQGKQNIQIALDSCDTADPETARNICESIIELYANQPWAQNLVQQARQKLSQLPQ